MLGHNLDWSSHRNASARWFPEGTWRCQAQHPRIVEAEESFLFVMHHAPHKGEGSQSRRRPTIQ